MPTERKFSLFHRKTKEEKIVEEMKKKQEEINKLKQEVVDMGKLVIKDGKIQKVEDTPQPVEAKKEERVSMPEPIPESMNAHPFVKGIAKEMSQPPIAPTMEQQQALYEQALRQQQMEMHNQLMQRQAMEYQMQQEALERQRMQAASVQSQAQDYVPQTVEAQAVTVLLHLITGEILKVDITAATFQKFTEDLDEAINTQSTFKFESINLNGRQIVYYNFE